jgi:hypothetical protein
LKILLSLEELEAAEDPAPLEPEADPAPPEVLTELEASELPDERFGDDDLASEDLTDHEVEY